ncbi:MAG: ferredoxin--NADP reductase [Nitratireductor sp.]|nr:ferredoxin--NADP reductase [Nitratireductor sp.]
MTETPEGVYALTVAELRHYTDRLFFFRTERPDAFRFRSGEFVMIGLPPEVMEAAGGKAKTIWRAYSIASPAWEEHVDFYSIKVPDGPLTSVLAGIATGDTVWMRKKPTGTLVHDALVPGKRLFLLCTGTGIAPFASIIRDPETYEKFEKVYVIHTCRENAELQYGFDLVEEIANHEILSEIVGDKLVHWASCTREAPDTARGVHAGRMTDAMRSGALYEELGIGPLNPETCRVMICGSMDMLQDCKQLCEAGGLVEGSNAQPGQFVIERAFVG